MTTPHPIRLARSEGVLMPRRAWAAHTATGVPYYVICAFLLMETGGGVNEYGHDVDAAGEPRPMWGAGEVTEANYAAYLLERDLYKRDAQWKSLGPRSQGVGPMQLTYYAYQDQADAAGGCWEPGTNIRVAAQILTNLLMRSPGIAVDRWWNVARMWNGNVSYANKWRTTAQRLNAAGLVA